MSSFNKIVIASAALAMTNALNLNKAQSPALFAEVDYANAEAVCLEKGLLFEFHQDTCSCLCKSWEHEYKRDQAAADADCHLTHGLGWSFNP